MNDKTLARGLAAALASLALLAGCADPNARAVVITQSRVTETVKDIDVVLVPPGTVGVQLLAQSMDRAGWSSGNFERDFCQRLVDKFLEKGIRINRINSFWGPHREMKFGSVDPAYHAAYQMVVIPTSVRAMLPTRGGRVLGPTDDFAIMSRVTILKNRAVVWEAKQEANMAPIDPTGAERFSIGILNSMMDSGLIEVHPAR